MENESPRETRRSRGLLFAAYLLLTAAVLADLLTGPQTTVSPVLASVPVLAGSGTRNVRVPLVAGVLAALAAGLLALVNPDVSTAVHVAALAAIVSVTLASAANVVVVTSRERELRQVRSVAEAAQQALLRPVPPRLGSLRIAVRYAAAAAEARIGGDLYEVLETRYGVRVLLGDVEGKGLSAVDTAADVLGVFREAARTEPDLARVAERLDAALARRPDNERFVTAVLVGIPKVPKAEGGADAELVNCGHPAPLLLSRTGRVSALEPTGYAPPLGLLALTGGTYHAEPLTLRRGDLLLLYTDGLSESRDAAGRFYPLAERLADAPALGPGALLDHLLADVRAYTGGSTTDDSALLAVRRES
ncbi:PP2C family protein-serine/threonine phosphatase [Kitasatospora sp. MAP5-34]|uniref:PP2C family protein-serine/threonine phosphatase n=1 Tax=Kitasatospora sp. MAP5-34 TaxID=3035102 RepID=UPI00247531F6|nr:PP2C family protein-serine/threonine phosphatase [Kitasatospora sp. MAP5-34]MDH6576809.1 serine phosphatase RsbU (regulator of sigma subunit) [Kitasatospora sp. MAP5-34]